MCEHRQKDMEQIHNALNRIKHLEGTIEHIRKICGNCNYAPDALREIDKYLKEDSPSFADGEIDDYSGPKVNEAKEILKSMSKTTENLHLICKDMKVIMDKADRWRSR